MTLKKHKPTSYENSLLAEDRPSPTIIWSLRLFLVIGALAYGIILASILL